jgi:hypothetical protein
VRESRTLGSLGAKPNGLATRPFPAGVERESAMRRLRVRVSPLNPVRQSLQEPSASCPSCGDRRALALAPTARRSPVAPCRGAIGASRSEGGIRLRRRCRGRAQLEVRGALGWTARVAELHRRPAPCILPADRDRPLERHPDLRNFLILLGRKVELRARATGLS